MAIKSNTTKILIFAVASALVGALLYAGGFYLVKEKVRETSLAVGELEQLKDAKSNVELVNQNIIDTQKDRERIEGFFIDSESVVPFIERIEALGAEIGVETTLSDLNKQNDSELVFTVKTVGTFQDVVLFNALLENLPFSLTLNKAHFSQMQDTQEDVENIDNIWEGNFTATLRSFVGDME